MGIASWRHEMASAGTLLARLKAVAADPEIAALDELRLIRSTTRGSIYRGRSRGRPWSVAIKLYSGAGAAEKARRLFDQHLYAFERCRSDPCARIPEPLACLADPPAYAMRYVPGRAASSVIRRTLLNRAGARAVCLARAARWLDAFHHRCEWREARFAPGVLLRDLEARLAAAERVGEIPHRAAFDGFLERLRETGPRLGATVFPAAAMHGDFNLHNVIVERDATWAIDFAGGPARVRPVSLDITCCLFFLELRDGWRAADRTGTPGGFDRAATEIFARAYPDIPWHSPATAWLFLHHQLGNWTRLHNLHRVHQADTMLDMCRHAAATLESRAAGELRGRAAHA